MSRRRHRVVPWVAAGVGLAIGVVVIAIASRIGDAPGAERRAPRIVDAKDIPRPEPLTSEEQQGATRLLQADQISLQDGAWVQVADDTGRLEQQYSAARIDPEPDKWLRMQAPRAVMFPSGGRVVTMRADRGRMRVPKRALESGQLEGGVVIKVYKPAPGRAVDLASDEASIVIQAPEAVFDSVLGEVRCDQKVKVVTESLRFEGEGLTMLLTADGKGIERLTVERPLSPIEIVRVAEPAPAPQAAAPAESSPPGARSDGAAAPPRDKAAASSAAPAVAGATNNAAPSSKRDKAAASAAAPNAPRAPARRFYKLVLEDDVRIHRESSAGSTDIVGDRLVAVFSLDGDAVGRNLSAAWPGREAPPGFAAPTAAAPREATTAAWPLDWRRAPLAMALAVSPPQPERVRIDYRGRLVMAVAGDPQDQLAGADHVRLDIEGAPAKLHDEASQARVDCSRMRYESGAERVALTGTEQRPFLLVSPQLDLEGRSLDLERTTGKGRLEGAGRMRIGSADAAVAAMASAPGNAAQAMQSGDPAHATVGPPDLAASARTVRIQWSREVDLQFEPGADSSKLLQADFRGDVNADAEEVRLVAQRLLVECFRTGKGSAVQRVLADGGAKAIRLPEGASLAAKTIDLAMEQNEDGSSRPKRLLVTGGVEAQDKGQKLWTDSLDCAFRPAAAKDAAGAMELSVVQSTGAVQALLAEDARLWASSMDADIPAKRVALRGPDLLLVRGNVVADTIGEISVDEDAGTALAPGPGRCRYWPQAIVDSAPHPVPRPAIPQKPQMEALWNDGLKYARDSLGRASLELRGNVRATADRTPREQDEFHAAQATLTLGRDASALEQAADAARRTGLGSETSSLQQIHGVGDVRIESRAWSRDDRADEPRLFRLMAGEIFHSVATGESNVPAAGSLLIFDRDDENAKAAPASLFDARGSTRFRWEKSLKMLREASTRYRVTMDGGVELIHAGLRPQDTLTLTCDQLENTVERLEAPDARASAADAAPADFGSPMRLLRVRALGRVFVRTPEMDVECDAFDYDLHTRVATISSRPGRTITVMQKGKGSPIKADAAVWDMDNGRVRISNAAGSSFR